MLETFVPLVSNLINRGCVKIQKPYHTVMWERSGVETSHISLRETLRLRRVTE